MFFHSASLKATIDERLPCLLYAKAWLCVPTGPESGWWKSEIKSAHRVVRFGWEVLLTRFIPM
jgi:hypothetical protein